MKQFKVQDMGYRIVAETDGFRASSGYRWVIYKEGKLYKRGSTVFWVNNLKEQAEAMKKKEDVIDWILNKEKNGKEY